MEVDGFAVATDKGEPKLDRGTGFPTNSVEGETKSITDLEGAASPDFSDSSLGSPRSALSAARLQQIVRALLHELQL